MAARARGKSTGIGTGDLRKSRLLRRRGFPRNGTWRQEPAGASWGAYPEPCADGTNLECKTIVREKSVCKWKQVFFVGREKRCVRKRTTRRGKRVVGGILRPDIGWGFGRGSEPGLGPCQPSGSGDRGTSGTLASCHQSLRGKRLRDRTWLRFTALIRS